MLRLDYLLMSSVIDQAGDKLEWDGGVWCIKSFANRDNNGMQPVPDDFPVVVDWGNNIERHKASDVCWSFDDDYPIRSWKPDIDKLLEQQNEYDKQQEKPIEEIMINAKESEMIEFTYGQKIYVKDNNDHDFMFGCYHTDGESVLFMFDGGYGKADIDDVKATPFKTELDIAKDKQVEEISAKIWHSGLIKYRDDTDPLIKYMQENGMLAEIILPLKDK